MGQKDFFEEMYQKESPALAGQQSSLLSHLLRSREEVAWQLSNSGNRFLDIGCGEGELVFQAASKFTELYGIDIAESRIARACEKANKLANSKAHFQTVDISEGVPFDDGFFDAVCIIATLEFIFNPEKLIKEVNRILRKGGQLIVISSNIAYLPRRISALIGKPPRTSAAAGFMSGGTLHYFTLSTLTALIRQAGFSIVKKSNVGSLWFLRNWWKSLLASGLVIKAIKNG